jgi:hypothetical protein
VATLLAAAFALPAALLCFGSSGDVLAMIARGLRLSIDSIGWVFVPQLLLALAISGLLVKRTALRSAGVALSPAPGWLDAAIESALLLGMLGTISGMVVGFVDASPGQLEAGSLIHSLGTALRSSAFGFAVALVGVWTRVGGSEPEGLAP